MGEVATKANWSALAEEPIGLAISSACMVAGVFFDSMWWSSTVVVRLLELVGRGLFDWWLGLYWSCMIAKRGY